jgi:hypothetical protein
MRKRRRQELRSTTQMPPLPPLLRVSKVFMVAHGIVSGLNAEC